jgi:hypothetical protein
MQGTIVLYVLARDTTTACLTACLASKGYNTTLQAPNAMENAPQPAPAKPLHDPFGVWDIGLRKLLEIPATRTHACVLLKKTENLSDN